MSDPNRKRPATLRASKIQVGDRLVQRVATSFGGVQVAVREHNWTVTDTEDDDTGVVLSIVADQALGAAEPIKMRFRPHDRLTRLLAEDEV